MKGLTRATLALSAVSIAISNAILILSIINLRKDR